MLCHYFGLLVYIVVFGFVFCSEGTAPLSRLFHVLRDKMLSMPLCSTRCDVDRGSPFQFRSGENFELNHVEISEVNKQKPPNIFSFSFSAST
jgi:hypothetical protein